MRVAGAVTVPCDFGPVYWDLYLITLYLQVTFTGDLLYRAIV